MYRPFLFWPLRCALETSILVTFLCVVRARVYHVRTYVFSHVPDVCVCVCRYIGNDFVFFHTQNENKKCPVAGQSCVFSHIFTLYAFRKSSENRFDDFQLHAK